MSDAPNLHYGKGRGTSPRPGIRQVQSMSLQKADYDQQQQQQQQQQQGYKKKARASDYEDDDDDDGIDIAPSPADAGGIDGTPLKTGAANGNQHPLLNATGTLIQNPDADLDNPNEPDDWDRQSSTGGSSILNFAELERFRQMQKMLDHFSQGSIDPVLMIDEKGIIKSMNQGLLQLFGYRRWELVEKNLKMLMPPEIAIKHDGYLLRYKKSKCKRIIGETRDGITGVKKDGTYFPLILKVQEVEDENGGNAYVGVMRDMTAAQELQDVSALLSNILPRGIAERLKNGEKDIADEDYATVIFIDLVGFTKWTSERDAREVLSTVNRIFRKYDEISEQYGLEKIKTIGDCYMAVCGVPTKHMDHPVRVIEMAMAVLQYMAAAEQFSVRIGVCTGPLISGILEGKKMSFDIWGDTVNVASRFQSIAPVGGVAVSKSTRDETAHKFLYSEPRMEMVKGKGEMQVYFLQGRK